MGDPGPSRIRTDEDVLRDTYRFVRTEADDQSGKEWEVDLAKKFYEKLYKDVALIDLSKYKKGKYGCRWRTRQEVVAGKGETSCGALDCAERAGLETFEVPFSYAEDSREKLALVKVRLCQKHALQLQYKKLLKASKKEEKRKRKEEAKALEKQAQARKKRKRSGQAAEEPSDAGGSEAAASREHREPPGSQSAEDAIQREADEFLAQLV